MSKDWLDIECYPTIGLRQAANFIQRESLQYVAHHVSKNMQFSVELIEEGANERDDFDNDGIQLLCFAVNDHLDDLVEIVRSFRPDGYDLSRIGDNEPQLDGTSITALRLSKRSPYRLQQRMDIPLTINSQGYISLPDGRIVRFTPVKSKRRLPYRGWTIERWVGSGKRRRRDTPKGYEDSDAYSLAQAEIVAIEAAKRCYDLHVFLEDI